MPGGGGQGGGGFGGGGGAGFFSVSEPMNAQFGSAIGGGQASVNAYANGQLSGGDVASLIMNLIDPVSWEHSGGEGVINVFGDAMVVRQTETNHAAISELLKQLQTEAFGHQPIEVSLWLIKADRELEQQLSELLTSKDAKQKLTDLSESTNGYHVDIRTVDRMNATMSDGVSTPVISSRVPVVGTNSSGSQPIISNVFEGFSAAAHSRILPASEGTGIQLRVSTQVTAIHDLVRRETSGRETDTFHLQTRDLNGTVLCEADKPTVAGRLSVRSGEEEDSNIEKWILVASVSLADNVVLDVD